MALIDDDAFAALDEARNIAATTRESRLALSKRMYRARTQLASGQAEDAAKAAEAVGAEAEGADQPSIAVGAFTVAVRANLEMGESAQALALSTRAFALREDLGSVEEDEAEVFVTHGEALRAVGWVAEAENIESQGRARLEEVAQAIKDHGWRRRFFNDVEAHRTLMSNR